MATPFFGKRDETPTGVRPGAASSYGSSPTSASLPVSQSSSMSKPVSDAVSSPASDTSGSKLTVGPNIKLKGVEITDCDTLVVDGTVEATMNSRVIQISEQGAFKGTAEVDVAEIRGQFDGNLVVRQKLMIYATGKVSGTIRYGKLVVEEDAQLSGDIVFGTQGQAGLAGKSAAATVVKPAGLQAAA